MDENRGLHFLPTLQPSKIQAFQSGRSVAADILYGRQENAFLIPNRYETSILFPILCSRHVNARGVTPMLQRVGNVGHNISQYS